MRKSIDTYIQSIARDNEQEIREHYTTPIEHRIEDVMLTKHGNGSDTLQYSADGKNFEVDGEFYVDTEYRLHHTHIFGNGDEMEIVIPYKNGEHALLAF